MKFRVDSTYCPPTFPTSTIIGLAIGGSRCDFAEQLALAQTAAVILLTIIGIFGRIHRRRRLQQRTAQTTFVYATLGNSYGRPQSNVYHPYPAQSQCPPGLQPSRSVPGQMNSLNRQGMTVAPSFPQLPYPSPATRSAHTRSPTMPSPTHYSCSNQTPHVSPPSSPNSTRLPPPGFPLSPSPPSTCSRVSADPSTIQTPSISSAAHTLPHAMPDVRPSPPENMEMHPLTVKTQVANIEPPPAYTPI